MNLHVRAIGLITALAVGMALTTLLAPEAAAEKNTKPPKDTGERCSLPGTAVPPSGPNGEIPSDDVEFYPPGDSEFAINAQGDMRLLQCQKDGTWKDITRVQVTGAGTTVPGRVPVHTLEAAP